MNHLASPLGTQIDPVGVVRSLGGSHPVVDFGSHLVADSPVRNFLESVCGDDGDECADVVHLDTAVGLVAPDSPEFPN